MTRRPEIKPPSEADIRTLKAAVIFARDENESHNAQEKLDLATKLVQATKKNPSNRPADEERIKACSRRFVDLVFDHWFEVGETVFIKRDPRIANLAIDAVCGGFDRNNKKKHNQSHAFDKILQGFELMRRDGEGGDWVLDAIELIRIQRKPRA